jgi:hypothetical protein
MRLPTMSEMGWALLGVLVGLGAGLLVLYLIGRVMGA